MEWTNQVRVAYMSEKGGTFYYPVGDTNEYPEGEDEESFFSLELE